MAKTESDLIESAWGVIANAGDGNWKLESDRWRKAAKAWREKYHAWLTDRKAGRKR